MDLRSKGPVGLAQPLRRASHVFYRAPSPDKQEIFPRIKLICGLELPGRPTRMNCATELRIHRRDAEDAEINARMLNAKCTFRIQRSAFFFLCVLCVSAVNFFF